MRSILAAAAIAFAGAQAMAVPANPRPMTFTQPDGQQITLRLVGDEYFHYYLTEDGAMALQGPDGAFYLAEPGESGAPVLSKALVGSQAQSAAVRSQMVEAGAKAASAKRASREEARAKRAPMRAASAAWPSGIGLCPGSTYPVTGSPRVAIILVAFSDVAMNSRSQAYFTDMASKRGFTDGGSAGYSGFYATGSALDYFTDASSGKFTPRFDVLGPVTLPNRCSYYGGNDSNGDDTNPHLMVRDAIKALDATTDFSVYDNDGDGTIDNVYVIYAGLGEANGGAASTVWPHSWDLMSAGISLIVDGKAVGSYACSAEYYSKSSSSRYKLDGIGTFCHEFSHVMGLPDLYTTDYNGSADALTPGSYSIMDYGSYNNDSRTPPTYSIYERNSMGWAEIETLAPGTGVDATLGHILDTNKGYVIPTEKTNEFFLLENRQLAGWDAYLPGHGMLVWHIDYNATVWDKNTPNNSASHQYIDIVEAGGTANNTSATTMAAYPFPGSKNKTSLTSSTTPALRSWAGKNIDAPITAIAEAADGTITFKVCGGAVAPSNVPAPVCNITEAEVTSPDPVTVTLSLAANAQAGDVIMYMTDDGDQIVENEYTEPLTITRTTEMIYWAKRGEESSEVKTIIIRIEEVPEVGSQFTIVFDDNGTDSNQDLPATDFAAYCTKGSDVATLNSASSKVYKGVTGLKVGSSKANGSLVLDIAPAYQSEIVSVEVSAKKFNKDASSLSVNGSAAQTLDAALDDYTFTLDGKTLKQLTLEGNKRMYVKSITFNVAKREPSGIADVATEDQGEAVYYDLQGVRATAPVAGRVYIEVRGSRARKVVF